MMYSWRDIIMSYNDDLIRQLKDELVSVLKRYFRTGDIEAALTGPFFVCAYCIRKVFCGREHRPKD